MCACVRERHAGKARSRRRVHAYMHEMHVRTRVCDRVATTRPTLWRNIKSIKRETELARFCAPAKRTVRRGAPTVRTIKMRPGRTGGRSALRRPHSEIRRIRKGQIVKYRMLADIGGSGAHLRRAHTLARTHAQTNDRTQSDIAPLKSSQPINARACANYHKNNKFYWTCISPCERRMRVRA